MEHITKAQLKKIRMLARDKKARDKEGLFVAEGVKVIGELVDKGHLPKTVVVAHSFAETKANREFLECIQAHGLFSVRGASDRDLENASSLQHSQGIIAIMKKPVLSGPSSSNLSSKEKMLIILCDGVQDPGNMGAIIRSSVAFGVGAVIITGGGVDVFNSKVVRASSGMVLNIPILEYDKDEIRRLKDEGFYLFASHVSKLETRSLDEITSIPDKSIVAFGAEGKGLSEEMREIADEEFYIPISEKAESLNVAAAVAITLHTFTRA